MRDMTLKGRHVAMVFCGGFAVIIAVNVLLATMAVKTFPGLEVRSSYVASQSFNADRAAQEALGWQVHASIDGEALVLSFSDDLGPVLPHIETAILGRATHVGEDQVPDFVKDRGGYVANVGQLGAGNWNLRLVAVAEDGTRFRQRIPLRVTP